MAKSKKKMKKASRQARKVAPKAAKGKTAASKGAKATRAVAKAVAYSPKSPAYDDLPIRAGARGAAWRGVFGDDDEVGTINLLTRPERVIAAPRQSVGQSLRDESADQHPRPAAVHARQTHPHGTGNSSPNAEFVLDDYLDNFFIRNRRRNGTRSLT